MADIREFGASLLADVRKRNDDLYKKQRNEAYKMALLQTGVGMINSTVQNRTAEFLSSEAAMAARVKQRRGVDDAQFFLDQQERIDLEGVSAVEYFESQMMPYASEVAKEYLQERYLPETYEPWIRQQVRQLAEQRAQWHQQGFEAANQLSSPEDFAAFQAIQAAKEKSAFDWVTGSIKRAFNGKTRADADRETIDIISNSPEIQRAETVTALRRAFNQTGSLELATQVAAGVESGLFKEVEDIVKWEAGNIITSKGPFGEDFHYQMMYAKDRNGGIVIDANGNPSVVTMPLLGADRLSRVPPRLSQIIDSLTPGEIESTSNTLQAVKNFVTEVDGAILDKFQEEFSIGDNGEIDPSRLLTRVAAQSKAIEMEHGLKQQQAEALSSRILVNRLRRSVKTDRSWYNFRSSDEDLVIRGKFNFNFAGVNLSSNPDAIDFIEGIADLEGTAHAVEYDWPILASMLGNINEDFAKYSPNDRSQLLAVWSDEDAYPFLHTPTPDGFTIFDLLVETDSYNRPIPVEEVRFLQAVQPQELWPANEVIKDLRKDPSFLEDARIYLNFLEFGPNTLKGLRSGEDIIETLRDEVNKPSVRQWRTRNIEEWPDDVRASYERLHRRLANASYGSLEEWLIAFKDNGIDAITDPTLLLALGSIGKIAGKGIVPFIPKVRPGTTTRMPPNYRHTPGPRAIPNQTGRPPATTGAREYWDAGLGQWVRVQ